MKHRVLLGGYSSEVPPLPIPNREVKLTYADGTAYLGGRVGSRLFKPSWIIPTRLFCVCMSMVWCGRWADIARLESAAVPLISTFRLHLIIISILILSYYLS